MFGKSPSTSAAVAADTESVPEPYRFTQQELEEMPPGVAKIQIIGDYLTLPYRVAIFASIFCLGFAYGLGGTVVGVYQSYATASYGHHSLLATSNVLKAVFSACVQPSVARLTDIFGRFELIGFCAIFFVVGLIVQSSSHNVGTYVAGAVLMQMGISGTTAMVEVIIADFTSTRSRLFFYMMPNLHLIVTIWLSGYITSSFLSHSSWRWGIGMWAFVYVAAVVPFVGSMVLAGRNARRHGAPKIKANYSKLMRDFFWKVDVPGLFLLVAALALILAPISLAGGSSTKWKSASIIVPIVLGFLCIPAFIIWELVAKTPMLPFKELKDRSVWGAIGIAIFFSFAAAIERSYLYTVLVVAFNFSVTKATRVSTVYSFMSFISGPLSGLAVIKVKRLRYFMISGVVIFTISFGVLLRYRGGLGKSNEAGIIAGQVFLGLGAGLFGFAASVAMQASLKHDHVATMIAVYLACHNIGGGFGASVAGSIWTQILPKRLGEHIGDPKLAKEIFGNPFKYTAIYPVGTPTRTAMIESYKHVQKLLVGTSLGLCLPLIIFALVIKDRKLSSAQTLFSDSESNSSISNLPKNNTSLPHTETESTEQKKSG